MCMREGAVTWLLTHLSTKTLLTAVWTGLQAELGLGFHSFQDKFSVSNVIWIVPGGGRVKSMASHLLIPTNNHPQPPPTSSVLSCDIWGISSLSVFCGRDSNAYWEIWVCAIKWTKVLCHSSKSNEFLKRSTVFAVKGNGEMHSKGWDELMVSRKMCKHLARKWTNARCTNKSEQMHNKDQIDSKHKLCTSKSGGTLNKQIVWRSPRSLLICSQQTLRPAC